MTSRFRFETEAEYREAMTAQRAVIKEMEAELAPYLEAVREARAELGAIGGNLNEFREHTIRLERAGVKREIKNSPTLYHLLATVEKGPIDAYTYYSSSGIALWGVEIAWSFSPPYTDTDEIREWLEGLGLRDTLSSISHGGHYFGNATTVTLTAYTFEHVRIITRPDGLDLGIPEKVYGLFPKDQHRRAGTKRIKVSTGRVTAVKGGGD